MLEIILHFLSIILVPAFLIGMVGSAVVVLVTVVLDIKHFRTKDTAAETAGERIKTAAPTA